MASIIHFFLEFQNNIRLYHWNTTSFARHKASDELVEAVVDLSDKFVESYIGRYGRPAMDKKNLTMKLTVYSDKEMSKYLSSCMQYLEEELHKLVKPTDVDLLTLRDELVAAVTKTMYLFTLA